MKEDKGNINNNDTAEENVLKIRQENYLKSLDGLKQTVSSFNELVIQAIPSKTIDSMKKNFLRIAKQISEIVATDYMKPFQESFSKFAKVIEEAKENPYSYYNYHEYQGKLDTFHWAWPYRITAEELKCLVEQANDEAQFDKLISSYFTNQRLIDMFSDIENALPRKHKVLFKQIENSYKNKDYAIINNAVTSIIDNLLSVVLINKGCTTRKGILQPIIEYYSENYNYSDIGFIFELHMLSNNIDLIFNNYNFSEKVIVDSKKKARRHLATHGIMYSNRKADCIMLLNTLMALIDNLEYIKPFSGALKLDGNRGNKHFIIASKSVIIKNRISRQLNLKQ